MPVYYNEIDPQKAAWLRELMRRGVVAEGEVDERSVRDVRPSDLAGYTQCHFFAGIAIWSYALRLAGWPDDRPVWTGSCPCPSFSAAGKGQGFDDPRHLWPDWFRLARECRPPVLLGEQVDDAIGHGWLDLVQTDLEKQAYAVGKAVLGACSVGAPHIRQRLYFCADTAGTGHQRWRAGEKGDGRNAPRIEPERLRDAGCGSNSSNSRHDNEGKYRSGLPLLPARSEQCGPAIGSPESVHAEWRDVMLHGSDGRDRQNGGREEAHGEPGAYGEVCERGDAYGTGRETRDLFGIRATARSKHSSESGSVGDARHSSGAGLPRCQSEILSGTRWRQEGGTTSEPSETLGPGSDAPKRGQPVCGSPSGIARHAVLTGATRGFWADCDWWFGKDGRYRPIERGLQPLAHGLAARIRSGCDSGVPLAESSEARVLRLKGYGDGIVAQAAAAFVRAYMEARGI